MTKFGQGFLRFWPGRRKKNSHQKRLKNFRRGGKNNEQRLHQFKFSRHAPFIANKHVTKIA